MDCPRCGQLTSILLTRARAGDVRRRRQCNRCGHRFTTHEGIREKVALPPKVRATNKPVKVTARQHSDALDWMNEDDDFLPEG